MGLDAVMPKAMLWLYYEKRVERHEEDGLMRLFRRGDGVIMTVFGDVYACIEEASVRTDWRSKKNKIKKKSS